MSQNGHCPNCKCCLDGGDIKQTFLDQGKSEEEATRIANMYGYDRGITQWGRQIGIYDMARDSTTKYKCPDCGHVWDRVLIRREDGKFEEKKNGD